MGDTKFKTNYLLDITKYAMYNRKFPTDSTVLIYNLQTYATQIYVS